MGQVTELTAFGGSAVVQNRHYVVCGVLHKGMKVFSCWETLFQNPGDYCRLGFDCLFTGFLNGI